MSRTTQVLLVALWAAFLVALGEPLRAQSKATPSLDEELMKQLQSDPLDDVDGKPSGPDQAKPAAKNDSTREKTPPKEEGTDLKRKLTAELGAAAVAEDDDPLLTVARRMHEVESRIAQAQSGAQTQQAQKQIVADLEGLIQEARKSCAGSTAASSGSQATGPREKVPQPSPKPGTAQGKPDAKPARNSTAKPGTSKGTKPDVQAVRAMIQQQLWGSLPERERQQLLQLPMEEFLPKYEQLIIEYFRRLTQEQGKRKNEG